jgi:hypothetical protein
VPVAGQAITDGVVVSATRVTLVIKTADDDYKLFELTPDTIRPTSIPVGAKVFVLAGPAISNGAPLASQVRVTALPPTEPAAVGTTGTSAQATAATQDTVPPTVRRLEQTIQRESRFYHIGVRGGTALDPELVLIGAQGAIGPLFNQNFWARPNIEIGFGEVTDLVAVNFEGIYRVPITGRESNWSTFFGAGPGLVFSKLGFDREDPNDNPLRRDQDVSFDDFDLGVGLNVVAGVQQRSGLLLELKATAYAGPGMRFMVGYTFF